MMNPKDVLLECAAIIGERGADYGNQLENNFSRISDLFALSTGVKLSAYQAAIFLACVKLARMQQSPHKMDNYFDCINYLSFAASMIDQKHEAQAADLLNGKADLDDFLSGL